MQLIKTIENLTIKDQRKIFLKRMMVSFLKNGVSLLLVKTSFSLKDIFSTNKIISRIGFVVYEVSSEKDIDSIINKLCSIGLWHKSRFYILFLYKDILEELKSKGFQKDIRNLKELDSVNVCAALEPLDNDLHFFTDQEDVKRIIEGL